MTIHPWNSGKRDYLCAAFKWHKSVLLAVFIVTRDLEFTAKIIEKSHTKSPKKVYFLLLYCYLARIKPD